jgi:hypothetical protein
MSVRSLKRREVAYIKRLEEVRGVSWHVKSNNLILCAELIKLWYSVAAVPVKDK